jgi:hypothetical protein
MTKTAFHLALCGMLMSTAGCVLGRNSDDPVLSVDLLWDKSETSRFSEGTCESADVAWMEWTLKDKGGDVVRRNDKDDTDCQAGFDFFDLDPGTYTLTVTGYDEADEARWASKCTGLTLERFDTLYECEIEQAAP